MFGLFNTKNPLASAAQITNALALTYAAYDFYTNPRFDALPGMVQYALNIYSVTENAGFWWQFGGFTSSTYSLGFLRGGALSLAGANHLLTGLGQISMISETEETTSKPKTL